MTMPATEEQQPETLPGQEPAASPEGQAEGQEATPQQPSVEELQTRLTDSEKAVQKLTNDLKTATQRGRRQVDLEATLQEINDELQAQRKTQDALIRRLASGEPEHLADDAQAIQQEFQAQRGQRTFAKASQEWAADIQELIRDDDGQLIATAEDLQEATRLWNEGIQKKDDSLLAASYRESSKVVKRVERQKAQQAAKAAHEEADATTKRRLEAAGVHDVSGGRPAGATGRETLESLSKKDTRRMSYAELQAHEKALDEAMRGR